MSEHADTIVDLGDAVQEMSEDVGETAKENCNGSIIDTGHTYAITATSPVRCRNIAIMATDPNKALSGGEEVVVKKARVTSLKFKDASIQHGHGRRETRKVSRQRSVTGSARRLMNSPPPKQTPPLNPDEFSGSVSRRSSSSQSPRPPSSASSRPLYPSPPPRRVSTPLYVIGSPPSNDQDQISVTPTPIPGMTRTVLVKMATLTSPVLNRSISPVPTSITMARSSDDSRCNYSSLDMVRKTQEMAEDDVRDSVRLQKMFRKLQRQVHSPEHQVECLESLLQIADRRNRLQSGRRSFAEPSQRRHDVPDAATNRRVTLGNIGRSETLAIPEKPKSRQSYRGSPRRDRRMSGGSYRAITDEDSFGMGTDVSIDFEELSSPILERPTTLPEMNSRPASRVMKSFSCDEGDIERQKRKTATAIVTSGALTFMILAAALVTASFLMSPVIEDVFVKGRLFVHRKMNQTGDSGAENLAENSTSANPYPSLDDISSVHQDPSEMELSSKSHNYYTYFIGQLRNEMEKKRRKSFSSRGN